MLPEEPEHPKMLPSASSNSFSLLGTGHLPHPTAFGRNNGHFVNHPSSQGCQPSSEAHRGLLGLLPLETSSYSLTVRRLSLPDEKMEERVRKILTASCEKISHLFHLKDMPEHLAYLR